jgi:hypothetical protein
VISARDELLHLVSTLSEGECERALALLAPLSRPEFCGPSCPDCGGDDLLTRPARREGQLDDSEYVTCWTCGFSWDPNHGSPLKGGKARA